jgi:hypothetical protein
MTIAATNRRYRSTDSKGGAHEMYVTYDLEQKTRGGESALYHKVKRVYIAGESGIGDSFGKGPGVNYTACGSNMSRPARATVEGGTRPGGARRNILWH